MSKLNLPNTLTLLRIALVPIMAAVYLMNFALAPLVAVLIFIVAAATDFFDGRIARKRNIVTDLGKLLDPIADKLLTLFSLFLIAFSAILQPAWLSAVFGAIIIGRELFISILRQIAASKNIIIQANIYGKIKTSVQFIAIPVLMILKMEEQIAAISQGLYSALYISGYVLFALATALTLISGVIYLIQNKSVISA